MGLLWDSIFLANGSMMVYGMVVNEIETKLPEALRDPRKLVRSQVLMDTGYMLLKYQIGFSIGVGAIALGFMAVSPTTFSIEYNKKSKDE